MLAFAPKRVVRPLARSLVQIRGPSASTSATLYATHTNNALKARIPVDDNHGLYAFFRKKDGADLTGDARFETVESPEHMQRLPTGRGWKASELRLKSFQDLHTLWYVVLRERNLLATQKEETRRMGVTNTDLQVSADKVHQCRKTMARIKAVINERRLAYEGAVKLAETQKEEHLDSVVLQHQITKYKAERKYLIKRREYHARKRELLRLKAEKELKVTVAEVKAGSGVDGEGKKLSKNTQETRKSESPAPPSKETEAKESEETPSEVIEVKVAGSPRTASSNPAGAAAAGLFGTLETVQQKTGGRRRR